jgi:class 3 adenylate cyclase/tetratricopeptide (TPR) repeat protein
MAEATHTRRSCTNCGSAVRATDRFCANCGTPLHAIATAPQELSTPSASLQVGGHARSLLGEQRKVVTILFADLSGSTPLAERLDPEELRGILASYFGALARQIQRYEGTIDKYIGDAVMAVFGAPIAHEDDAERAINAALAMQASIARLNDDLDRRHGVRLSLRIGVNTGEVVAGMLAGDVQSAYTVVGDAVNTAQRLESAAPLGGILVSASTRHLAIHSFEFEETAPLTLKGKAEPVVAYRVRRRRYEEISPEATPFVARSIELELLRDAVADAVQGRGRRIVVSGEAGVGKSRLVAELRAGLVAGIDRLVLRCTSFEQNSPYAAVGDLIRGTFLIHYTDDEATAERAIRAGFADRDELLGELQLALLLDVLGYQERSRFEPEAKRRMLVTILRRLLHIQTKRAPLVFVAEDLQWIDDASAGVLVELVPDIPQLSCLLICTARSGWAPPWPSETIEVMALSDAEAHAFIETVFEVPVQHALALTVLQRTGGNPFFIEEVIRELQASKLLIERAGRMELRNDAAVVVPATVRELLQARIDRLPDGPRRVLELAAVSGRTFWKRVVEQLVPDRPVTDDLAYLEHERLIATRSVAPELTYTFRQALIQEVAYGMQLQSQRRSAHGAVAQAIESLYAGRLDEFVDVLAYHWDLDDDDAKALLWLVRAADRAKRLFANDEAVRLYRSALRRATDDDGALAATILERIGEIQTLTGHYDDALATFAQAGAKLGAGHEVALARVRRWSALVLERKGSYEQALVVLDEALGLAQPDATETAQVRLQLGHAHFWRGEYAAARENLAQAVGEAERAGADDVVAEGLKLLGNVANNEGDIRGAAELYERSRAAFERLQDVVGVADVRSNLGMIYRRLARWDESLSEYQASLELRERVGHQRGIATSHNNIGEVYRTRGTPLLATPHYKRSIEILDSIGATADAGLVWMNLGSARIEAGDVEAGRVALAEAGRRLEAVGRTKFLPELNRALALAELKDGRFDAATEAAQRALRLASDIHARHEEAMAQRVLAEIAIAIGDGERARRLLDDSLATLRELGEATELARTEAVAQRLSGP